LFNVRECTKEEALEILRDVAIVKHLAAYPHEIYCDELLILNGKILAAVIPNGDEAEVHIACKYRDRVGARQIMNDFLLWLKGRGFSRIVTGAPESRKGLINMLLALGFRHESDRWVYR